MLNLKVVADKLRNEVFDNGFAILNEVYSEVEVEQILDCINSADSTREAFRKSDDIFAIRQFLKEIGGVTDLIFNENLKNIIDAVFGENYFVIKSIYFDKPETSNWYVAYHQDLTISVDERIELPGFGFWTKKQNQFSVQPPLAVLENIFTIRIHLDETDKNNGALKVISKSHQKGIYRPESINWDYETEAICNVAKGGIMIMKPLVLHSSARTTNNKRRRVIHIEFSDKELPSELKWAERLDRSKAGF